MADSLYYLPGRGMTVEPWEMARRRHRCRTCGIVWLILRGCSSTNVTSAIMPP
ncbi:MAG: hypothetical protein ACREDV_02750 [Methylocella sp.]